MNQREAKELLLQFNQGRDIIARKEDGGVFISLGAAIEAVCEAYRRGSGGTTEPRS